MNKYKIQEIYEKRITNSEISKIKQEELLDRLEKIFDELYDLECDIETEKENSKDYRSYISAAEMDNEFMYSNRMC